MEELSSVGEQVFAAECILSKRLRKVGSEAAGSKEQQRRRRPPPRLPLTRLFSFSSLLLLTGQAGVFGEVERLVFQVSRTMKRAAERQPAVELRGSRAGLEGSGMLGPGERGTRAKTRGGRRGCKPPAEAEGRRKAWAGGNACNLGWTYERLEVTLIS